MGKVKGNQNMKMQRNNYAKSSLYNAFFGGGYEGPARPDYGCNPNPSGILSGGGGSGSGSRSSSKKGLGKGVGLTSNFYNLLMEKKEFMLLVFSNLIVQLGISYYLMMNYKGPHINTWAILFGTLSILFIMIFVPMPSFMKFLLFCLFSALFGINLSNLSNVEFTKEDEDRKKEKNSYSSSSNKDIIQLAILQTLAIFGVMFLFGAFLLATGIQLSFQFAGFLFYGLLFLILSSIGLYFSGNISKYIIGLSTIGLIIFSLYIIYDTNMILRRDYYGDFITASMDYYLDILNLFTNLFNLNNN